METNTLEQGVQSTEQPTEFLQTNEEIIRKRLFEHDEASKQIQRLIGGWNEIENQHTVDRIQRLCNPDISQLVREKKMMPHEHLINVRMIDTNISREKPSYIAFLAQASRVVSFTLEDAGVVPGSDVENLADAFSRKMRYPGWQQPHFKLVDGMQVHGWDALEVVFDMDKPLHVGVEHVGHNNLIFHSGTQDLQDCEMILKRLEISQLRLRTLAVEKKFNMKIVEEILSSTGNDYDSLVTVYKVYFKFQGVVHLAWYADKQSAWLKEPEVLVMGMKQQGMQMDKVTGLPVPAVLDLPMTEYPFFICIYDENEDHEISAHQGRAYRDKPKQEAATAMWSAIVNKSINSSFVLGAPKHQTLQGNGQPKEIKDLEIRPGMVLSEPFDFVTPPGPEVTMLGAAQALDSKNDSEVRQVNYAAMNRQDSRKTATEIQNARQEQMQLSSVQITLYSDFVASVYSFAWKIVQNRAMHNLVYLIGSRDALGNIQNNIPVISQKYILTAMGDTLIKKEETLQRMRIDWPVLQTTALAQQFLLDYLQLSYPEKFQKYSEILMAGDQKKMMIQRLLQVGQASGGMMKEAGILDPQMEQQMLQLGQEAQQVLAQT